MSGSGGKSYDGLKVIGMNIDDAGGVGIAAVAPGGKGVSTYTGPAGTLGIIDDPAGHHHTVVEPNGHVTDNGREVSSAVAKDAVATIHSVESGAAKLVRTASFPKP